MEVYTTTDAEKILGIKYGRFRQWFDDGYIEPSIKASGQGTRTILSREDLYLIKLFSYLVYRKLFNREDASERIKRVANYKRITKSWSDPDSHVYIAFYYREKGHLEENGKSFCPYVRIFSAEEMNKKPLNAILFADHKSKIRKKDFDDAIIVNFGKIVDEVDRKIDEFHELKS
jgi:hypothetical protein